MRIVVFAAILGLSAPLVEAGQTRRPAPAAASQAPDATAQAYEQFLRAHMLEEEDVDGAIAAYKRAIALDPTAAAIPADLAELYMREEKLTEAETAAQQAIRLDADNRDAHRVLGTVYATLASGNGQRISRSVQTENLNKAIQHLEQAFDPPLADADANLRAMLARLYIAVENYDKAIPVLAELVKQEPGWSEGPNLLVQAYSAAGRAGDAVTWLEENAPDNPLLYTQLGDYYVRARRYADAATAFEQALAASPNNRSSDLRRRLASALMNTGNRPDVLRARDVLKEALAIRANDEDAMGLLSRAELAAGDSAAAETMARQLVAQNARSTAGYVALAEALEAQRKFQPLIDALVPGAAAVRSANNANAGSVALLLTHLGFAYQELGQYDKAVATFEDAQRSAPNNPQQIAYVIQAQMLAKNYTAAAALAKSARAQRPNDLRFARLESQALRRSGKVDEGLAVMEDLLRAQGDDPDVHIALAQAYTDANRSAQAVKVLRDAQVKFPAETSITFELGAALDKQKKYSESEALFRQLIAKDPENAIALNYLGYMLAERGERLNESVDFLKRALAIDPDNGSFLDSIGWAYFKDGKFDLALDNLKKAADQLGTNSVVQDHYGELLFKLGRYDDAIGAWNKALLGDGDSIDRTDIDKKIRSARQKLPQEMSRRPNAARWARTLAVVSSLTLTLTACGGTRLTLPGAAGTPATDAAEALAQATAACRTVTTFTAELSVSGRVAGRRLRARILAGTASPSSMFLDAPAPFGASVFQLAASGTDTTLILPRDRRVLEHAGPEAVLEALTGVPLSPAAMHLALTGCVASNDVTGAREAGSDWRIIPGDDEIYLHRANPTAPWQLVAVVHRRSNGPGWRTEHRDFMNGLPRTLQLVSADPGRFDLRVSLSQVETNAPLEASTFQLKVPAGFSPITLDELRAAGPLAEKDR